MRLPLLLVLAIVGMFGCATVSDPVQNPEQLRTTHGFVRVTLPLAGADTKLALRATNGGAWHELRRDESLGAHVFGSWLPAGEYEIPDLSNLDGSKYLGVRVNAGQMTELGGLVPIQLGGYEVVMLPIRHPEIAVDSVRAIDRLSRYLTTRQQQDWVPTQVPKPTETGIKFTGLGLIADLLVDYERYVNKPPLNERLKQQGNIDEMYNLAMTALPPQVEEPAVDVHGNLYFGAELGQVRVRRNDGTWSSLDTGTLQAITAVASFGTRLIAGTSRGMFRASDDGGQRWRQIAAVSEGEAILDIDRVGSRWLIITSRLTSVPRTPRFNQVKQLNVYTTTSNDFASLSLIRQIDLPNEVHLWLSSGPKGQVWGNSYYVNGITELLRLDSISLQWSVLKLPHNATTVNVSKTYGTITATLIRGAFSHLHVSTDDGVTWQRRDTPSYPIYDVNFESAETGLGTRFNTGMFSSTIEFVRYDPSTDRWQRTHEGPAGCVRILRDAAGIQRYCLTSGGSVLNFVEGKWVVEFAAN